ncbi:MAG: GNAT family N-acetyltransferase [Alphaproteobacteria bacterium]|nr:GNAT family N-acetyltransferase [Alphaproteobacteria bacterium]MCB9796901.1 GNAT family N-acetyltransferase [Alphaproteobacteria bacterium]
MLEVRPARAADRSAIEALLAPEIEAGTVLFREVDPADFIVAADGAALLGAVALTPWSAAVAELGSLVSAAPGRGVGAALIDAVMDEARRRGHREIVALTGIPGFFERLGFTSQARTPHAVARQEPSPRLLDTGLEDAIAYKAGRCAACPRLAGCSQSLLSKGLRVESRRACA